MQEHMTRAALLRRAAAAGLSLPAMSLLAACGGSSGGGGGNAKPGPLNMTAWEAYPDQIKSNLKLFGSQFGPQVKLSLIPNIGYGPALQTRLQGGGDIDVFYNFAYNSTKFVDAGWAAKLNDLPQVEDMLADMFPSAAARHKLPDGRIVSVPYFSAVHLLMYNAAQLKKNGIAAPPTTKEEVYDQSKKLKAAGVKAPYAAYWTKQFVEEYFILYLTAEGITPFDAKGAPVFADDPKTAGVLEWWKSMLQDGLVGKSILTDDPGKHVAAMGQGSSSFFTLHHYFLKEIRGSGGKEAGNVDLAYRMPGAGGASLQIGEVVQLGAKAAGKRAQDAWDLLRFYGWKDKQGKYGTFVSWAKSAALLGPYPKLFDDPDFKSAFPDYYDMDQLKTAFEGSQVVPTRVAPWYASFQTKLGERIHAMLLNQASVKDTISTLADDARNFAASS
jgi:multiple sugar transport system substrate-binding protein